MRKSLKCFTVWTIKSEVVCLTLMLHTNISSRWLLVEDWTRNCIHMTLGWRSQCTVYLMRLHLHLWPLETMATLWQLEPIVVVLCFMMFEDDPNHLQFYELTAPQRYGGVGIGVTLMSWMGDHQELARSYSTGGFCWWCYCFCQVTQTLARWIVGCQFDILDYSIQCYMSYLSIGILNVADVVV